MPIDYEVEHDRRLVLARGRGRLTDDDVFGYQRSVWSRPDVRGYDELVDMRSVEHVDVPSPERLKELVSLAASMDAPETSSKFAIVATDELAVELGRFFKIYRELDPRSTKEVSIFRTMDAATRWLGVDPVRN